MSVTIEIGGDLYRALQSLAIPFEENPADVIARLIRERVDLGETKGDTRNLAESPGGLLTPDAVLRNGLKLRFNYRKKVVPAEIRDDRIWIGATSYSSPSAAATGAAALLGWPGRSLNGWWYWEYEDNGRWHPLGKLRRERRYRRKRGTR